MGTSGTVPSIPLKPSVHTPIVVSSLFLALDALSVLLRFVARSRSDLSFGSDDALMIAALLTSIAFTGAFLASIEVNGGRVEKVEPAPSKSTVYLKYFYALEVVWETVIGLIKLSVLQFYHRIFPPNHVLKKLNWALTAATTLWMTVFILITIFQCQPVKTIWDSSLVADGTGKCLGFLRQNIAYEVINIAITVAILALPIYMLRSLQLENRRKFALGAVFVLAGFDCIIGIIRVVYMHTSMSTGSSKTSAEESRSWGIAEAGIAMICANMPVYGPLFRIAKKTPRSVRSWYRSSVQHRRSHHPIELAPNTAPFHPNSASHYVRLGLLQERNESAPSAKAFCDLQPPAKMSKIIL